MTKSKMQVLFDVVQKMEPGADFDTLVEQILYGAKAFTHLGFTYVIFDPITNEQRPAVFPVREFSIDRDWTRLLFKFLPENIWVSQSWMRFNGISTYVTKIDDVTKKNTTDAVFIEVIEKTEEFALAKAILLWKIKTMLVAGEKIDLKDYWFNGEVK